MARMDQEDHAGHHAVTREAVRELFASGRADASGRIDGLTEEEYFAALDAAQEYQDRWYGPTIDPAWLNPDAQRQHGMADPRHDGLWNLATDRQYVEDELAAASRADEMRHLGNAVHALEDSYSEAHAWRAESAAHGDPTAPVESFNVFNPLPSPSMGTWGVLGTEGTHDHRFDAVPVDEAGHLLRGTDQAAAHATAAVLGAYHDGTGVHDTVASFYRASPDGVDVNGKYTAEWAAERDRRLHEHAPSCWAGPCDDCQQSAQESYCGLAPAHPESHACPAGHYWYAQ